MLTLQACSWDYLKMTNGDYVQKCIVSYGLQLSSRCLNFSRSNKENNRLHKCTTHVYCIPPKKQTRLYKDIKPTNDYHALLPKSMHRNSCFYTHKSLHSSNRQHSYKVNNKIILSCLEICTISIVVIVHSILEIKHYKLPSSKVMLHPAPQIKLWGGEDLEVLKRKHLLSKTSPKFTRISFSLTNKMLTLQIHIFEIYKCMPSYKNNIVKWNSLHKNSIVHRITEKNLGPQFTYKRNIIPTCIKTLSLYAQNIPSQINAWTYIKNLTTTYYKTTRIIIHSNKNLKNHIFGYQHISPLTYTIGISSHRIHILFLSLHSTAQNRIWRGKNHVNVKSKIIKLKIVRSLTQYFYFFRMSLRATNSSSSQRYKEKLLALENDPDIEMFTTQKRSSTSQVTANQKKAKGKSNSGFKHPLFGLDFKH